MKDNLHHSAQFVQKNIVMIFVLLPRQQCVWDFVCLEWGRRPLKSEDGENDRDCERQTFKSRGRHVRIMKHSNPNNPRHTEASETKGGKSCRSFHSWDRFITRAKANFDKQLGTISPNLWVILCNIQSTISGESES